MSPILPVCMDCPLLNALLTFIEAYAHSQSMGKANNCKNLWASKPREREKTSGQVLVSQRKRETNIWASTNKPTGERKNLWASTSKPTGERKNNLLIS